ncbi:MAG: ATP-dependent DNA ligase [Actinomycetota bacterium]|nr:ATP-dependent DNA ligase [Actinomycetota bacterium]
MRYTTLVEVAHRVAATPKRSEKVGLLADLLASVLADDAPMVVGLLVGEPLQGRMGVGWATLTQVWAASTAAVSPEVTIRDVDATLTLLAGLAGEGSQRERERVLAQLMQRLTTDEQRHLAMVLSGEMHQGASQGVVADAIAKAAGVPAAALRRAAMLMGDLGAAASVALRGESLEVGLTPGVGVQPMLASTAATVADALAEVGAASVEWKLDGARVQVHRRGDDVRVFTRSLREISGAVPEVVRAVLAVPAQQFVLDGEALGLDEDGNPLKFQDSMSAGSALRPFFFDALFVGGHSLIDEPLHVRKAALAATLPADLLLPTIDVQPGTALASTAADEFAAAALAAGHEGVMVKALASPYQAGRRGAAWRKVKPVHTLDLVVLAAEWGHGRRTGWLSNLHLGARGADGAFVMVGKTFKGLTDELLRWQTEALQRLAIGTEGIVCHVRPELVVEIAVDGVQRSTRYPGGVALRFARVRRYRPDKSAAEADTIERVQAML